MDQKCVHKLLEMEESIRLDSDYQALLAEHTVRNARFLEIVNALDRQQQDVIFDYLGVILEIHNRMLEFACGISPES